MIHVMPDLETWATQSPRPVLIALGAVKFDSSGIIDRFEVGIDPDDCIWHGLDVEAGTIDWWMDDERAEARKLIRALGRIDLFSALDGFAMWVNRTPKDQLGKVWGNGAVFDNAKLQQIFRAAKVEWPFGYKDDACYRTIRGSFPELKIDRPDNLVLHNPVDDAEFQALHLIEIAKAHGINL